jgi:Mor family transcriptional regulator
MAYTKAHDVLPGHLLEAIQNYIDGEYLYIPRRACNRKAWGEARGSKQQLAARNAAIYAAYARGVAVRELASIYHLSAKAIYKVVAAAKKS